MPNVCPICDNPLRQYGKDFYVCEVCETYFDKNENIVLTEQEWLQTATTEQLADFLSKIEEQYPCGSLLKCDVTCGYHSQCRNDDVAPTNKEAWVEWLKQPHTEKE